MDITLVHERIGRAHKQVIDTVLGDEAAGLDPTGPGVADVLHAEALARLAVENADLKVRIEVLEAALAKKATKK